MHFTVNWQTGNERLIQIKLRFLWMTCFRNNSNVDRDAAKLGFQNSSTPLKVSKRIFLLELMVTDVLLYISALSTISQLPVHPDQEAFTLQQFGFEPISRIEAPVLLTQSAITPSSTSMYSNTNENVSAGQNVGIGNLATLAFAQEPGRNSTEENVFRNNPDNPFWGVPSSFDCTEWTEWNERTENQWLWPTTEES